jgi:hypothetical protein
MSVMVGGSLTCLCAVFCSIDVQRSHFQIIRIVANMSINPVVGSSLTCSSAVFCCNNVQEIDTEPSDVTTTEDNQV